ncbi:MAG: 4'-phosphopantetheinyl transferase superfamily protein [Deltaproteobacteria bacterium]|jgi:phosphopantetheinyl transferase|nr:4'-phosphopantetheinyl transferase superfamily protein [Deltaproteobacteria bacterium]
MMRLEALTNQNQAKFKDRPLVLAAGLPFGPAGQEEEPVIFLWPHLSASQREALARSRRSADRALRLLVRLLLVQALDLKGLAGIELIKFLDWDAFGRPILKNSNFFISFSHSFPFAACALSLEPIGADVENALSLGPNPEAHSPNKAAFQPSDFKSFFNPEEILAIQKANFPASELIRRFTIKEAILKAKGTGLLTDPLNVDSSVGSGRKANEGLFSQPREKGPQIKENRPLLWWHLDLAPNFWLTCATPGWFKPEPAVTLNGTKIWPFTGSMIDND